MKHVVSPVMALIVVYPIGLGVLLAEAGQTPSPAHNISYLDNDVIRLAVDLRLGGSITYLAESGNKVNSHDWGRQIQMSFYSGLQPFAPNGKQPSRTWAGLGWNPIQSGDCAGNRSVVTEHRNNGALLYVKCIPMQWPLDNEPGECTFESWIRLRDNTVAVRCRINNHRADRTQYFGRGQELPAIYTNGPWHRLMSYVGDRPFTNGELSQFKKTWTRLKDVQGSPWENWLATEGNRVTGHCNLFNKGPQHGGQFILRDFADGTI